MSSRPRSPFAGEQGVLDGDGGLHGTAPGGYPPVTAASRVFRPLRATLSDRWTVDSSDGPDLEVKGNIVDHEYEIAEGGQPVAGVSTKWFRVAGTYGVEVGLGQVPVPILAGAAVPDTMAHEQRRPTRIVMSTSARLRRLIRSGRRRPAPRRSR